MTANTDPSMFGLPEEELRRIFEEQIRPVYTGAAREHPVVVFIAGQPGAGKTTVESQVVVQLGREEAVAVDGDDLFEYHPDYARLAAENDQTVRALLADAASRWWTMLAEHIRGQQCDAVISAPLAGADWAAARFDEFHQAGYRVEYVFVAVHEARSLLAVLDRYQRERNEHGVGRFVSPEIHDRAYPAVLVTADRLEDERLVDAAYVVRRGGETLYRNALDESGSWSEPARLREAIEGERSRAWTAEERDDFSQRARSTAERIGEHLKPALAEAVRRAVAHLDSAADRTSTDTAVLAFLSPTRATLSQATSSSTSDRGSVTGTSSVRGVGGDRAASR